MESMECLNEDAQKQGQTLYIGDGIPKSQLAPNCWILLSFV